MSSAAARTVFVDTNLETHLALSVSVSDTIAHLKKKILLEHPICFPKVGDIEVHALKVKRRGCFYHLPDSMYIINVFDVVAKSWYLYVDVSTLSKQSEGLQFNPNSDNQLVCFKGTNNPSADVVSDCPSRQLANLNDSSLSEIEPNSCMNQEISVDERLCSGDLSRESLDTDKKPDLEMHAKLELLDTDKKPDVKTHDKLELHGKDHELPDKQTECMIDDTMNGIIGTQCNNILLGGSMADKPIEKKYKKKKPTKKRKDAVDDLVSKEKDLSTGRPSKDTLQQNVVPLNSMGSADKEATHDARMENASVVLEPCRNSSSDARKQLVSMNDLPKGNEISVQQAEGNNDKSENGVVNVQPNNLSGVISEHESPAKKKRKRLGSGMKKTNDLIEEDGVSVKHVGSKNDKSENGIVGVQCNTLLGDNAVIVHSSPAKKKRKVEKNNSNKDAVKGMSAPAQSLGEKRKNKNATSDLDVECIEDIHSLRTNSSSGKKKKKSKSTAPLEVVPPILSPVRELRQETTKVLEINQKDSEEPDAAGIGESVLGETIAVVNSGSLDEKHDRPVDGLAEDVDMGDTNEFNAGAETDVPQELEEPAKEMDTSRSGQVDVKNWPLSTVQDPNDLQGTVELFSDHDRTGVDQTDILIEARETEDPIDETPEPASSCKKPKNSKRTSGRTQVMPSTEIAGGLLTDTLTAHKSLKGDDYSVKSKTKGSILSQLEGNDASKLKSEDGISLGVTSAKTVKRTISKIKAGGDSEGSKKKRKTKKQQIHATTDLPEIQEKEKEQNVGSQSLVPSIDIKLVDFSSKKAKEKKSSKTHSMNPDLLPVKDTGAAFDPLQTELLSGTVDCSQVSLPLVKSSDEKTLEVVGNVDSHNSGHIEEDNQMEVSCESNRINFKDYFINGKDEQEVKSTGEVLDNKVNKKKTSDRELKDKKHKHKLDVYSGSASPDTRSSLKVNENQGNAEKAQGDNSSTIKLHGSSLKNESGKPLPQSKKKLLKPCESGISLAPPKSSRKSNPVSEEARKSNVPDASAFITPMGKNIKAFAKQTSSLESPKVSQRTKKSSKQPLQNNLHPKSIRKASGSNMGEVVNNTNPKSLLATSGAIFKDDSSIGSHYDQAVVDSDATTITPSDNLSSSDGEGSYSSKLDEGVYENSRQSRSAVPKNMTLDTILRSSSRYKKVKLSASQSQLEDTESQPLDFVPDSQADA